MRCKPVDSTPCRTTVLRAAMFCLVTMSPAAHAIDVTVSAGSSVTASRDFTPTVNMDVHGTTRHWSRLAWQPVVSIGWLGGRDIRPSLDDNTAFVAAGTRVVDWWRGAFFSMQVAYVSKTTDAVSSHVQFVSTLGWEGDTFVWMVRHISNANFFGGKNLGETMLLAGMRF